MFSPPPTGPASPNLVGALLMGLAVTCIAIDSMLVRIVSTEIHPFEIAFFRNLFSVVAVLPFLLRTGTGALRTTRLPVHLLRAGLKLFGLICFFFAVAQSPLAMVTAIAFSSPLVIALGSMTLLGEPWRLIRLVGLAVGFVGILVVIRPGLVPIDAGIIFAVMSAVGLGAAGLLMKFLSVREPPHTVVTLNVLMTVPLAALIMLPVWVTPSPLILGLMVIQGVIGGISQLSVSRAMSMADASLMAPIEFLRLPLVMVFAWVLFQEPTEIWTVVGGTVIFAATFVTVLSERRRRPIVPDLE